MYGAMIVINEVAFYNAVWKFIWKMRWCEGELRCYYGRYTAMGSAANSTERSFCFPLSAASAFVNEAGYKPS